MEMLPNEKGEEKYPGLDVHGREGSAHLGPDVHGRKKSENPRLDGHGKAESEVKNKSPENEIHKNEFPKKIERRKKLSPTSRLEDLLGNK